MPTLTPTYDTGATTAPMPTLSVPALRQHVPGEGARALDAAGFDGAFIEGMLSAALTHERCGRHLYRSVAGRTNNPALKRRYQHFGDETEEHVAILEEVISAMGGDPQYMSPAARAVEKSDMATLESTFLLAGSVDLLTQEAVMLDAVLLAETLDHANWAALADLAEELPDELGGEALRAAVAQVEPQEDEHLSWASETKRRMTLQQATGPLLTDVKASASEMMAAVRRWFADDDGPAPGADGASAAGASA